MLVQNCFPLVIKKTLYGGGPAHLLVPNAVSFSFSLLWKYWKCFVSFRLRYFVTVVMENTIPIDFAIIYPYCYLGKSVRKSIMEFAYTSERSCEITDASVCQALWRLGTQNRTLCLIQIWESQNTFFWINAKVNDLTLVGWIPWNFW